MEASIFFNLNFFHLKMLPYGPIVRTQFNQKIFLKELYCSFFIHVTCIFGAHDVLGQTHGRSWGHCGSKADVPPCPLAAISLWGTHTFIQLSQTFQLYILINIIHVS